MTFEEEGALDKLEAFASVFGPRFYCLPLNDGTVTLKRAPHSLPSKIIEEDITVVPFHAGETLPWRAQCRCA